MERQQCKYCALCVVWSGLVWSVLFWSGLVWSGLVWSGLIWSPSKCQAGRMGGHCEERSTLLVFIIYGTILYNKKCVSSSIQFLRLSRSYVLQTRHIIPTDE